MANRRNARCSITARTNKFSSSFSHAATRPPLKLVGCMPACRRWPPETLPYPARLHETRAAVPENRILVALKLLMDAGFVEQDEHHDYRLTRLRAKQKDLMALIETYHEQSARDHAALERVV